MNRRDNQADYLDPQVDRADGTLLGVSLDRRTPGGSRVIWCALPVDNHVLKGDFTIAVAR